MDMVLMEILPCKSCFLYSCLLDNDSNLHQLLASDFNWLLHTVYSSTLIKMACTDLGPCPARLTPDASMSAGWWIWFYWLSPTAYSIYGLVGAQLGDVDHEFVTNFRGQRVSVSQYLIQEYGLHHDFIGYAVLVLCAFIIFFRSVAILATARLNYQKR